MTIFVIVYHLKYTLNKNISYKKQGAEIQLLALML